MKRLIIFFLTLAFLNSCKALIEPKPIEVAIEIEEIEEIDEHGKSSVFGKIVTKHQKPITSVAIKLVLNNSSCLNSYSNFNGDFSFLLDISKINKDSYYEIVYKGYTKKY